jgi:hypothetical protein
MAKNYHTNQQEAERFNISVGTWIDWVRRYRIPRVVMSPGRGGLIRYVPEEVDAVLAEKFTENRATTRKRTRQQRRQQNPVVDHRSSQHFSPHSNSERPDQLTDVAATGDEDNAEVAAADFIREFPD